MSGRFVALALLVGLPSTAGAQEAAPGAVSLTPAESADYLAFTISASAMSFLGSLAVRYPGVRLDTISVLDSRTAGRRVVAAVSFAAPTGAAPDRPTVLVMAGQHGDERAGVEAALMLIRDLATGRADSLLQALDIRVVPIMNPWGLDNGERRNEDGLDLNRDHMRLRSQTVRGLHATFAAGVSAVLDLHELGPVVYDVEVGVPTHPNVDAGIVEFARFYLLPFVANRLARNGLSFHDYIVQEPPVDEIHEGIEPAPDSSVFMTYAPIVANNARNVFALGGAVTFLVEVASTRDIEGFEQRSRAMRETVGAFLEAMASQADELRARVHAARGDGGKVRVVLRASNVPDLNRSGHTLLVRSEFGTPTNGTIEDWRPVVQPLVVISAAAAYVVDSTETGLVSLALQHGLQVARLLQPAELSSVSYVGRPGEPEEHSGELIEPVNADDFLESTSRLFPAGSFLILADQPAARLLWTLIEPWSQDGWFSDHAGGAYPVHRLEGDLQPTTTVLTDSEHP